MYFKVSAVILNAQPLTKKGDRCALHSKISINGIDRDIATICWLDRHRRHFVTTAGNISDTVSPEHISWTKLQEGAFPIDSGVRTPLATTQYHDVASIIARHNRVRQDSIDLEKAIGTQNWVFRFASTVIGVILTDCSQLYHFGSSGRQRLSPHSFFSILGTEMIDNDFDMVSICSHFADYAHKEEEERDTGRFGVMAQLIPVVCNP